MKFPPTSSYNYRLECTPDEALARLRRNTEITNILTSTLAGKYFRGKIEGDEFRIVSSGVGHGEGVYAVMSGKLNSEDGIVLVEINKFFTVPFFILVCLYFTGAVVHMIIEMEFLWVQIVVVVPLMVVMYFGFIEFNFRRISKKSIQLLGDVLGTESMKKN